VPEDVQLSCACGQAAHGKHRNEERRMTVRGEGHNACTAAGERVSLFHGEGMTT
jgi:hypothetical protein